MRTSHRGLAELCLTTLPHTFCCSNSQKGPRNLLFLQILGRVLYCLWTELPRTTRWETLLQRLGVIRYHFCESEGRQGLQRRLSLCCPSLPYAAGSFGKCPWELGGRKHNSQRGRDEGEEAETCLLCSLQNPFQICREKKKLVGQLSICENVSCLVQVKSWMQKCSAQTAKKHRLDALNCYINDCLEKLTRPLNTI